MYVRYRLSLVFASMLALLAVVVTPAAAASGTTAGEGGGGKTPEYHSSKVYVRDFTGNKILNASTGALLGTFAAGPAPAFAGQAGLFLNAGTLQAVGQGKTLWSFTGDSGLDTAPIVVGSTVYEGSSSGMLYGLALHSGKVVWSTNAGSGIPAPDEQNPSQPLTGRGRARQP
jgi:outer membrane protein assembly factor BamB